MEVHRRVLPGLYRDSVTLMQLASEMERMPGIGKTGAMMASEQNLELARDADLLSDEGVSAGPNDLLLIAEASSAEEADAALGEAERKLSQAPPAEEGAVQRVPPSSIRMALSRTEDASMALISTPGPYAASEALKALDGGLDVMIFSDNVSPADELMLKRHAHERGLLVMGPDCGTAIVAGVPLGFANVVWRDDIGCIGASGTGLQEITTLIDRWGGGITHALGTGSHDISSEVGGISMCDGIAALASDPELSVLVVVSKPPAEEVGERILEDCRAAGKPTVVCFLGADGASVERPGVRAAATLEDAAALAIELAKGAPPDRPDPLHDAREAIESARAALAPSQRYVRGLYSGGTFGYEASMLLAAELGDVHANTPTRPEDRLADVWTSVGHTILDLGDDVFTRGRPHPMIDFRLRAERIAKEAADPEVAVILFDAVIGYGANPDPAGELVPVFERARETAAAAGRTLAFVGSVCGTERDPQSLSKQEAALSAAGAILAQSNAGAARIAIEIVRGREGGAS